MSRILVAEDDPDIANLLAHYLQRAGFEADVVVVGTRRPAARSARRRLICCCST